MLFLAAASFFARGVSQSGRKLRLFTLDSYKVERKRETERGKKKKKTKKKKKKRPATDKPPFEFVSEEK